MSGRHPGRRRRRFRGSGRIVAPHLGESGDIAKDCNHIAFNGGVAETGRRAALIGMCSRAARADSRWRSKPRLVLNGVRETSASPAVETGMVLRTSSGDCPFVNLIRNGSDYLETRNANTRRRRLITGVKRRLVEALAFDEGGRGGRCGRDCRLGDFFPRRSDGTHRGASERMVRTRNPGKKIHPRMTQINTDKREEYKDKRLTLHVGGNISNFFGGNINNS